MDAKEIKSLLKQAREAINKKEFKTALKHCKSVLNVDKENYNAWVFVGAAAQELNEFDQAEAAFKRALDIAPDQLLALQGLTLLYEKMNKTEYVPQLISCYERLIEMKSVNKDMQIGTYDKLINLLKENNYGREKIINVLQSKLESVHEIDHDQEFLVQKQIFQELSGQLNLSSKEKDLLIETLKIMIAHESFSEGDCNKIFATCIEAQQKSGDQNLSMDLALLIYQKYPDNTSCMEFLCRTSMNIYIEKGSVMDSLQEIYQKMKQKESKGLNAIFQGFVLFISKNYVDAIKMCNEGLKTMEYCLQGWYFLSLSQLCLHQYKDCIRIHLQLSDRL